MKKPEVQPPTLDQEIVLSCAFRYALGRMTYVVSSVADEIERYIPVLSITQLSLYSTEISDALLENRIGMDMDADRWVKLRNACDAELKRRKSE